MAIPETRNVHTGLEKPYSALAPVLSTFGMGLPPHLSARHMHLDPDFEHLTYGDQGERARQLRDLFPGDLIVFYASLFDGEAGLVYAIIGIFVVEDFILAAEVPINSRHINAHSRRILPPGAKDLIVRGRSGWSAVCQSANGVIALIECGAIYLTSGVGCTSRTDIYSAARDCRG